MRFWKQVRLTQAPTGIRSQVRPPPPPFRSACLHALPSAHGHEVQEVLWVFRLEGVRIQGTARHAPAGLQ